MVKLYRKAWLICSVYNPLVHGMINRKTLNIGKSFIILIVNWCTIESALHLSVKWAYGLLDKTESFMCLKLGIFPLSGVHDGM